MMEGRKALFIIAHKNFRDEEFAHPKAVLEKQGVKVTVASSSTQKAVGMLGMTVQPDILLSEVKVDDYDLVVFVGGSGSDEYWEDAAAHRIAETAFQEGKIVAAICIAPVTLANAGLLKGRKATVFSSCVDQLKEKGAIYADQPVVQDGRIITASGPDAANSFGEVLLEALKDQ
jgi:protease I